MTRFFFAAGVILVVMVNNRAVDAAKTFNFSQWEWDAADTLATPVLEPVGTQIMGEYLICGGQRDDGSQLQTCESFLGGTWRSRTMSGEGRSRMGVALFPGPALTFVSNRRQTALRSQPELALFCGGRKGSSQDFSQACDLYNATSRTFSLHADLGVPRSYPGAVSVSFMDNLVLRRYSLFAGGRAAGSSSAKIDIFDPFPVPHGLGLKQGRQKVGAAAVDEFAIFAGGHNNDQSSFYADIDILSLRSFTVVVHGLSLSVPRGRVYTFLYYKRVFFIGGATQNSDAGRSALVETVTKNITGFFISRAPDMPIGHEDGCAVPAGLSHLIIGGGSHSDGTGKSDDVFHYDAASGEWLWLPGKLSQGSRFLTCAGSGAAMVFAGGERNGASGNEASDLKDVVRPPVFFPTTTTALATTATTQTPSTTASATTGPGATTATTTSSLTTSAASTTASTTGIFSTTRSAPQNKESSSGPSSASNLPLIIGAIAAAAVCLLLLVAAVLFFKRRGSTSDSSTSDGDKSGEEAVYAAMDQIGDTDADTPVVYANMDDFEPEGESPVIYAGLDEFEDQ
jgi:hypothetical protein